MRIGGLKNIHTGRFVQQVKPIFNLPDITSDSQNEFYLYLGENIVSALSTSGDVFTGDFIQIKNGQYKIINRSFVQDSSSDNISSSSDDATGGGGIVKFNDAPDITASYSVSGVPSEHSSNFNGVFTAVSESVLESGTWFTNGKYESGQEDPIGLCAIKSGGQWYWFLAFSVDNSEIYGNGISAAVDSTDPDVWTDFIKVELRPTIKVTKI